MAKRILWLTVPLGAAAGAVYYYLNLKKKKTAGVKANKTGSKLSAGKAKGSYEPKSPKIGSYSFISGFQDAATIELSLPYDAECFSFTVTENDFLTESGDSHVALLYGEKFSAQFEYAGYYRGEDFEALAKELTSRHHDLSPAVYGNSRGVCFQNGEALCFAFPVPEDSHSYLLVSVLKAKDNDDELVALREYPDLAWMFSSMAFSRA